MGRLMPYPADRPYFPLLGSELEELFKRERHNRIVLEQIKAELVHRERPAMRRLAMQIDEALAALDTHIAPQAPASTTIASRPVFPTPRSPPTALRQNPAAKLNNEYDIDEEDSEEQDGPGNVPQQPKQQEAVLIRPRGDAVGAPETYIRDRDTSLVLMSNPGLSTCDRYITAIEAHVAELKARGGGQVIVAVHDGHRVSLEGAKIGYQFQFDGEVDEIFEGAGVMIRAGRRASPGRVVTVFLREKAIVIETEDDLGETVAAAELRIDNSAMLQQLADRLRAIGTTDAGPFNQTLAEAAMCNGGTSFTGPPLVLPPKGKDSTTLDSDQEHAARTALGNTVSYIWGPPGTGKTVTLTGIVHSLFTAEERVLVCSNTNQAVDQILYRLCSVLNGTPLVENGRIVRVGRIELEKLKEFAAYVTPPAIAERLGENLRKQKAEFEAQMGQLARELAPYAAAYTAFRQIAEAQCELAAVADKKAKAAQEKQRLTEQIASNLDLIQAAEAAMAKWRASGPLRRILLESEDVTKRRIATLNQTRVDLSRKVPVVERALEEAAVAFQRLTAQIQALQIEVRGYEPSEVQKKIKEIDARRRPVADALAAVNRQLVELEESILKNAKVIGATVTKLYLSPKQFQNFDTVIIDEASMVLPPALFHSAGLAKKRVVVCGDFRQLPPIVTTDQQAIFDVLGCDVFHLAGITDAVDAGQQVSQLAKLTRQRRMADDICQLINDPMYSGCLITEPGGEAIIAPTPFEHPITIIDTSSLNPFVGFDDGRSRYNLVHAVVVRNAALRLREHSVQCGVTVGFKAQSRLIGRMLKEAGAEDVIVGVVHRFQGDERQVMVLDLPEGIGDRWISRFLQGESPHNEGPRLLNVAISRAKSHLVIVVNRRFMDAKLPNNAVVRDILHKAQQTGAVIDARDVLAFRPVDWAKVIPAGAPFTLPPNRGLFDQNSFAAAIRADFAVARESVVIFSGFITVSRVASYGDTFRQLLTRGVKIRCVTRSALSNSAETPERTKEALEALRQLGCVVDLRATVHQKVVLIDSKIAWFGSLNPLSYTTGTGEVMMRVEGEKTAKQIAEYLALPGYTREGREFVAQENPVCERCGTPTVWVEKREGFFLCISDDCGWSTNLRKQRRQVTAKEPDDVLPKEGFACPICGGKTRLRSGPYGHFYSCVNYPKCKGKHSIGPKTTRLKMK